MARWPARRKYDPLQRSLATLPAAEVTLTLGQIAAIIGAPLPASARGPTWWANAPGSAQAGAWRSAGWRVAGRRLWGGTPAVTFARVAPPHRAPDR